MQPYATPLSLYRCNRLLGEEYVTWLIPRNFENIDWTTKCQIFKENFIRTHPQMMCTVLSTKYFIDSFEDLKPRGKRKWLPKKLVLQEKRIFQNFNPTKGLRGEKVMVRMSTSTCTSSFFSFLFFASSFQYNINTSTICKSKNILETNFFAYSQNSKKIKYLMTDIISIAYNLYRRHEYL